MSKRLQTGEQAPRIRLTGADGSHFDSETMVGRRWLLSFHRYAS